MPIDTRERTPTPLFDEGISSSPQRFHSHYFHTYFRQCAPQRQKNLYLIRYQDATVGYEGMGLDADVAPLRCSKDFLNRPSLLRVVVPSDFPQTDLLQQGGSLFPEFPVIRSRFDHFGDRRDGVVPEPCLGIPKHSVPIFRGRKVDGQCFDERNAFDSATRNHVFRGRFSANLQCGKPLVLHARLEFDAKVLERNTLHTGLNGGFEFRFYDRLNGPAINQGKFDRQRRRLGQIPEQRWLFVLSKADMVRGQHIERRSVSSANAAAHAAFGGALLARLVDGKIALRRLLLLRFDALRRHGATRLWLRSMPSR